jgi:WD40 repeat protein
MNTDLLIIVKQIVTGQGEAVLSEPRRVSAKGHEYHVCSVAFSPDGIYIVSGSIDNTLKLWGLYDDAK